MCESSDHIVNQLSYSDSLDVPVLGQFTRSAEAFVSRDRGGGEAAAASKAVTPGVPSVLSVLSIPPSL